MQLQLNPNPLSGLIPEDLYVFLSENGLLNEKGIRDFQLRQQFRELREEGVPANDAIEELRERHPYLQFDTIRKIVYGLRRRH
ncbi:MAG: hypothetical protein ACK41D_05915 [Rubricoccaceae bacterium]